MTGRGALFQKSKSRKGSSQSNNNNTSHNDSDDVNILDQTEPPSYSDTIANVPTTPSSLSISTFLLPLPIIDFSKYTIPDSKLSMDGSTVSTIHSSFLCNPEHLVRFIQEQAALPPLPYIHIVGGNGFDFDIKINMLSLLLDRNHSNKWSYAQLVSDGELAYRGSDSLSLSPEGSELDEWARMFCNENSSLKSFTLTRKTSNWNTSYIEGQIRSLIASTGYNKPVKISFPVKFENVVVRTSESNCRPSIFDPLFSSHRGPKRYEVVQAIWPFASMPPVVTGAAAVRRVAVVQSEEEWWLEWKDAIRRAVLRRRIDGGWLSINVVLECRMALATT